MKKQESDRGKEQVNNLELLRDYRRNEVMGNKYRHPDKYDALLKK